ncbi:MAG: ATP-binding protein [Woeseiaceae bacterium]|nr:ATP-binding protein [Woeseiaceae bacterium]
MSAEIRTTQINLEGLLEVLGKNLYSTPVVVVRELVQNAFDACVRRRIESGWTGVPQVRITVDPDRHTLAIGDNGAGLTRQEIIDFLATIGSGYTRVLRNRTQDENAVGYFGLGFLTAYVVSDNVEFLTRSYIEQADCLRFASAGGQQYTIDSAADRPVGSEVVLHLKDTFHDLADYEFIEQIVRKYCCLLPIDIVLGDSDEPVNRIEVPWRLEDASELRIKKASLEFAGVFDHSFQPIVTIPLPLDEDTGVQGLLWIQDGSYYATSDNRITTIFIRSMHITDECKELLPEWAGFVGCVIDSASLTPTASRESVQQDKYFAAVRAYVKQVLIDAIVRLAVERGADWRRLQSRHNQSLLGASISDPMLFDAMRDQLALPTSEGELTVEEICKRSGERRLRLALEQEGGYEYLIARSMGVPVVYGYRFAAASFCRMRSQDGDITLTTLGSRESSGDLFPNQPLDDDNLAIFERYYGRADTKLVVSNFEPACLPAVRVLDQDALLRKRLEADELDEHLGSAALMLAKRYTDSLDIEQEAYLYLNYANPVIRGFIDLPDERRDQVAKILIAMTELMHGPAGETNSTAAMETLSNELLAIARSVS